APAGNVGGLGPLGNLPDINPAWAPSLHAAAAITDQTGGGNVGTTIEHRRNFMAQGQRNNVVDIAGEDGRWSDDQGVGAALDKLREGGFVVAVAADLRDDDLPT